MKKLIYLLVSFLYITFLIAFIGCEPQGESQDQYEENLAEDMTSSLKNDILRHWYPRVIDSVYGGYLSNFDYQWEPLDDQPKFLVTQARHVWTTSRTAEFFPGQEGEYLEYSEHGFDFLKDHFWDQEYGGFYTLLNRDGSVMLTSSYLDSKRSYGNAFAIYGMASLYAVNEDPEVLDLAKKAFYWLEEHAHDQEHGGYYQHLNRDGSVMQRETPEFKNQPSFDASTIGYKDQNTSIHLLEAFTELYKVWPDSLLRERTEEMLHLIRDVMVTDRGYLNLFFQPDWTPISLQDSSVEQIKQFYDIDHVSFGHDIETAYLMLEASEILGIENDEKTLDVSKKMVDHTIKNGWDLQYDGIYYGGFYFQGQDSITILNSAKTWWAQAEALNSLLLMSRLFPKETDYYALFENQWDYIKLFLIDEEHGGWYAWGLDRSDDQQQQGLKAQIWKSPYHNGRALMNCIASLRGPD